VIGAIGTNWGDHLYWNGSSWGVGNVNVLVGSGAGQVNQSSYAVAVGYQAGSNAQSESSVAIGSYTGFTNQDAYAVAVGTGAGSGNQGQNTVAIGSSAGSNFQNAYSVAIGANAGQSTQGPFSVAIGLNSGYQNQGSNAVAIGSYAGYSSQNNNSIVINASGIEVNTVDSGLYVAPISNVATGNNFLVYNTSTKNVQYLTLESKSYTPTWGPGIAYTGTTPPATGNFQRVGDSVQVSISIDFTNVTNFGTDDYTITLPYPSLNAPLIRGTISVGGTTHDLVGIASPGSMTVALNYWNNSNHATPVNHNSPGGFNTASKMDLYGSYLAQPL
jgi:hypothetical protein